MDDILASIRRILNDDDKTAKAPADGVLVLDPSMMVEDGQGPASLVDETPESLGGAREPGAEQAAPATASELVGASADLHSPGSAPAGLKEFKPTLAARDETVHSDLVIDPVSPSAPASAAPAHSALETSSTLVAPAAAAAATAAVDALVRTLAAERSAAVSRGVVTIEDLVREEIRPLLKAWLDNHLPPLVERLVQAEIERVVGRNAG